MLISPALLIERLQNACPLVKSVSGSADFVTAETMLGNKLPAAFVVPLADPASPNTSATMLVSQRVVQQFGVIVAVSNVRDATGQQAVSDLFAVRNQIITALLGWVPAGAVAGMEFGGGKLVDMNDQVLWWQDDFNVDSYLRSA
jgi:hypothetical protein